MYSPVLISALLIAPVSPEEFLQALCDTAGKFGGPEFWSRSAAEEVDPAVASRDSIAAFLAETRDLSVDPGAPVLLESDQVDFSYRASFPDAEWSWIDPSGRVHRATGNTVVISSGGVFRWVLLPPLEGSISVGPGEKILVGLILTVMALLIGGFALWWVKRRWGTSPAD